jgi:hypothetical protein
VDVSYVAMVVYVCCKRVYLDVAYVFTHMIQVFLFEWCVCLQWFLSVFVSVSEACFNVSSVFRRML